MVNLAPERENFAVTTPHKTTNGNQSEPILDCTNIATFYRLVIKQSTERRYLMPYNFILNFKKIG
jgi:hypothetical protein